MSAAMHSALAALILLLLLLLLAGGCAQNAALEVRIDLPLGPPDSDTTSPRFVLVQPRVEAGNPFEDEWAGDDLPAIELSATERIEDHFSVLSGDDGVNLHLKVRFCVADDCNDFRDDPTPERWFFLEHPFYIGESTSWGTTIDVAPTTRDTTPTMVDRCAIRGCVSGDLSMYCRGSDERHLCE